MLSKTFLILGVQNINFHNILRTTDYKNAVSQDFSKTFLDFFFFWKRLICWIQIVSLLVLNIFQWNTGRRTPKELCQFTWWVVSKIWGSRAGDQRLSRSLQALTWHQAFRASELLTRIPSTPGEQPWEIPGNCRKSSTPDYYHDRADWYL